MKQMQEGRTSAPAILRRPSVRYALAAAGVFAAILMAYAIYGNRPISVQVASVEHNVPVRVFGLGTVEARVLSKIGFEVGATLAELHADHGDRVTKGQVLARLSLGEQEAKVAKALAALEIATVNITRAEANLEKARAVLAQKQEANRRKQTLVGRDVVSQQVAEEAVRDEAVAKADVVVAESEIVRRDLAATPHAHSALRCYRDRTAQRTRHRGQGRRPDLHSDCRGQLLGACLCR